MKHLLTFEAFGSKENSAEEQLHEIEVVAGEMGMEIMAVEIEDDDSILITFGPEQIMYAKRYNMGWSYSAGQLDAGTRFYKNMELVLQTIKKINETFIPKKSSGREDMRLKIEAERQRQKEADARLLSMELLQTFKKLFPQDDIKPKQDEDLGTLAFVHRGTFSKKAGAEHVVIHWNIIDKHTLGLDCYKLIAPNNNSTRLASHLKYDLPINDVATLSEAIEQFPKGWSKRL